MPSRLNTTVVLWSRCSSSLRSRMTTSKELSPLLAQFFFGADPIIDMLAVMAVAAAMTGSSLVM